MAIVQHDEKVDEARRPQTREVAERAERATICDRFQTPLAINKTQYNAGVCYGGIRELPRTVWEKNSDGKRVKRPFRKEYITALSKKLGEELHLEPERIEDLIHARAAILGNVPCLLKEDISEQDYFRLKMLEKDWPGIHAEISAKRCYPLGRVGGEVIGYLGPISRPQYQAITHELQELRECLASQDEGEKPALPEGYSTIEEVELRLHQLEKTAYTINDFVGKMGVEAAFDARLRGLRGKHIYLSDTRGNFVRELPGSQSPVPGERIELTLSAELQAYAEKLLADYDQHPPSMRPAAVKRREKIPENQPWIRGGAIVAMAPQTGEIYAMATFPRFDPNDFILSGALEEVARKKARINQWLESEHYIGNVWDLKQPLTRERYDSYSETFYEEQLELDWDAFLRCTLPESSLVRHVLETKGTIGEAVWIQRKVEQLVALFQTNLFSITPAKVFDAVYQGENEVPTGVTFTLQEQEYFKERVVQLQPQIEGICRELAPYFKLLPLNYEKLLLTDLYRLVVDARRFTPVLTELMGKIPLKEYREAAGRMVSIDEAVCEIVRALYREHDFKKWREHAFKEYLTQRREEEKIAGRKYARPYIDYLDQAENERFSLFWKQYRWDFMALILTGKTSLVETELTPYLHTLASWCTELAAGAHCALPWVYHYHRLKDLIEPLAHTSLLFPYLQGLRRFEELDRPLLGTYSGLHGSCEKHLASTFYPTYGHGFARSYAFRQATMIGSIFKIIPAYEALRQRYEQNITDLNPLTIIDDKHRTWGKGGGWNVGYTLDGRTIPLYYRGGRLPRSEHAGVGRVDMVKALETSSNPYFALLAGDILEDPEDLCAAAAQFGFGCKTGLDLPGEYIGSIPKDVAYNRTGLYAMSIGQHTMIGTPLQTAVMLSALANGGEVLKPQIVRAEKQVRWKVFMPAQVQNLLLEGLRQVVMGGKGTARSLKHQFSDDLVRQIIGKTSTADTVERYSLDGTSGKLPSKDVWFGAISYESDDFSKPELVVVVYLRKGEWGKDAAPLVAKMVQKWREITSSHDWH